MIQSDWQRGPETIDKVTKHVNKQKETVEEKEWDWMTRLTTTQWLSRAFSAKRTARLTRLDQNSQPWLRGKLLSSLIPCFAYDREPVHTKLHTIEPQKPFWGSIPFKDHMDLWMLWLDQKQLLAFINNHNWMEIINTS